MSCIVCLAAEPWRSTPTRTQQLLTRLQGPEVLYFEPPEGRGEQQHKRPGRRVRPGVTVYTLPHIGRFSPGKNPLFRRDQRRLADYILSVMFKRELRDPLVWCATPEAVHLLDYLPYRGLVYDCDRYWTGLPLTWESELAMSADVVFAASGGLVDRLSPCAHNIAVVPNGCNVPMFTRADVELPAPLAGLPRPLLGYVGTLWADLDLTPVFTTAAAHPDWHFLFLGRRQRSPQLRRLQEMGQVTLLDRCPLIEVPDYVSHLDLCLDLRRQGVANDVCPGRVFEYLAAGRPVVRHSFPGQMEDLPGLIYQSDDPHGFAAACEQALREGEPWRAERRKKAGEEAGWDRRSAEVQRILEANMLL